MRPVLRKVVHQHHLVHYEVCDQTQGMEDGKRFYSIFYFFNDTWNITAHTLSLGYTHPLEKNWIFDFTYRYYSQSHADFYSDLFPFQDAQNFLARDKELSSFNDQSFGIGISYQFSPQNWRFINRGSLSLNYDHIRFSYDDFRNLTVVTTPGQEPLYGFSADTLQVFLSIWY